MAKKIVTAQEVVSILINPQKWKVINGINHLWPTIVIDGWFLMFFNDVGGLDYLDIAVSPDGRIGTFDDWEEMADKIKEYPANPIDWIDDMTAFQGKFF